MSSEMPLEVHRLYLQLSNPIRLLMRTHYYGAVAICSIAAIEAMGFLDRPALQFENLSDDFKAWSGTYLVLDGQTTISPDEWWAARCLALHTFGVLSSEHSTGDTQRKIVWAFGQTPAVRLIKTQGRPDVISVDLNKFKNGLIDGMHVYLIEAMKNPARKALIESRMKTLVMDPPRKTSL